MMSVTRCTLDTISAMVVPALCTSSEPSATRCTESSIRLLISLAAAVERCASVRTSLATTAKPRPCSPARAASTAALSARMLVWNEMPSMTLMISAIFLDEDSIPLMVSTTLPAISPPCDATRAAPMASWLAWRALSAFCLTVEVSSSIEAAVSSRLAACCSVRCDRSWLPAAISPVAAPMLPAAPWIRTTIRVSCSVVALASSRILANTPWKLPCMRAVRSPAAMDCNSADKLPRLVSLTSIIALRSCTMRRKSCSNRCASPRALKSPAAAALARRWISVLIANRLVLAASIDSCSTARLPGRRRASRRRSPRAYSLSTSTASTMASRCSNIMVLMPLLKSPYTPGKSCGMRWLMSLSACSSIIRAVSLEKRCNCVCILAMALSSRPGSSVAVVCTLLSRRPSAMASAARVARFKGWVRLRVISQASRPLITTTAMPPAISNARP